MAFTTTIDSTRLMPSLGNSNNEPIDLTGTDNEDELPCPEPKRARVNGQSEAYIPKLQTSNDHLLAHKTPKHPSLPALPTLSQPLSHQASWATTFTPQLPHTRSWGSQPTPGQLQQQFTALSRTHAMSSPFARQPHVTPTPPPSQFIQSSAPNVIDLTRDSPRPSPSPSPVPQPQSFYLKQTMVLPEELSPITAILIGQINVQALVLNPISYIVQQPTNTVLPNGQVLSVAGQEYVPVKLRIVNEDPESHDILVYTPTQVRNGSSLAPDNFAVVEKKVAARLQPLMSKRAIKLEAMIKTVQNGSNILVASLVVLVFTAKGNVSQIAEALFRYGLFLEHPGLMWRNVLTSDSLIYHNPHEGHAPLPVAPSANSSRWTSPAVSSKSVDIQRNAADAVFQTLRGEEDLPETSPGMNISTPLYPHQRKALSFLLEREQELEIKSSGKTASLWCCNGSGWKNSVTQEIVYSKPKECKGALLADDMGLGKTIETLCLLAYTLDRAQQFASEPLERPIPPEPLEQEPSTENFVNAIYDMPNIQKLSVSKEKKKLMYEKAMAEYNRLTRVKEKSRATLIICPLSTIVSWEEQIRDHWGGEVTVVGGVGTGNISSSGPISSTGIASDFTSDGMLTDGRMSEAPSLGVSEAPGTKSAQPSRYATPTTVSKRGRPIRVYVYHGASRRLDPHFIATFDVVITTYSTLSSEYSKQMRSNVMDVDDEDGVSSDSGILEIDELGNPIAKKKGKAKRKKPFVPGDSCSPLQAIYWFRVVLDEAHFIKEPTTVASRACCDLIADRRLCLTGTPLQNKVDDVYALIKFLRLKPFDDKATWTSLIGSPIKYNQPVGFTRLQTIMRLLALRRTKETKGQDGKPILSLPPRTDKMVLLKLQDEERTVYDSFFGESQAEFLKMGRADVMKNYVNILQKILRLRQICDDVELIKASNDGMRYDCAAQYEEALIAIAKDGINLERATAIFALLRETSTSQCTECGVELSSLPNDGGIDAAIDGEEAGTKRSRKPRSGGSSGAGTRACSPCPTLHPIITRCTHLYCLCCFRSRVCPDWPRASPEARAPCTVCQLELAPAVDAVEVRSDGTDLKEQRKKEVPSGKKVKRVKGEPILNYKPSTKVLALLQELMQFSKRNPHSANYNPSLTDTDEIQEVDSSGQRVHTDIVKSVVFSQWTTMLDKIEDALETANIQYERLDGTMKREERNKALDALKNNPKCEVILVSLKAGGVGLTLTAARRVYLMDPYWNPAVENQAIDRIHRLGQVNPVVSTKFIIENSIEQRLLEVQKKKADLAKLTLGKPLSKQDLQQRRLEELQNLLGAGNAEKIV